MRLFRPRGGWQRSRSTCTPLDLTHLRRAWSNWRIVLSETSIFGSGGRTSALCTIPKLTNRYSWISDGCLGPCLTCTWSILWPGRHPRKMRKTPECISCQIMWSVLVCEMRSRPTCVCGVSTRSSRSLRTTRNSSIGKSASRTPSRTVGCSFWLSIFPSCSSQCVVSTWPWFTRCRHRWPPSAPWNRKYFAASLLGSCLHIPRHWWPTWTWPQIRSFLRKSSPPNGAAPWLPLNTPGKTCSRRVSSGSWPTMYRLFRPSLLRFGSSSASFGTPSLAACQPRQDVMREWICQDWRHAWVWTTERCMRWRIATTGEENYSDSENTPHVRKNSAWRCSPSPRWIGTDVHASMQHMERAPPNGALAFVEEWPDISGGSQNFFSFRLVHVVREHFAVGVVGLRIGTRQSRVSHTRSWQRNGCIATSSCDRGVLQLANSLQDILEPSAGLLGRERA